VLGRTELTADLQEPFFFLGVLGDIDLVDVIFQTQLFEGDVHFVAVGCAWISLVVGIDEAGFLRIPAV